MISEDLRLTSPSLPIDQPEFALTSGPDPTNKTGVIHPASTHQPLSSAAFIELDIAIVGAGPAGAAAALALAGSGLKVGIIEKAIPPRHKTCGGGVLRRATALLPLDLRSAI